MACLLELRGISKTFPGVKALTDVHFKLHAGQIHALMGENGAGKSTFIKVITGIHQPDAGGEMLLDGKSVRFSNPKEATQAGIAAIYQHVTCYPDLTVAENIFIGHEQVGRGGRVLWREMNARAGEYLARLGTNIDPRAAMGTLSVAQQQIVEIAKAISTNARILIMDEPTAALTRRESEDLYRIAEQLRDEGKGIIFISHRFEDTYRLASHVTVFRDSRYIGDWPVDEITGDKLIYAMVGRSLTQMYPEKTATVGEVRLRVQGLSKVGHFKDVSFDVRAGEIVAVCGLVGAGRSEVCQAIFGYWPHDGGKLYLDGKEVNPLSPREAMNLGIGYLPEDRQKQGLILDWAIGRNITLATLDQYERRGVLSVKSEEAVADKLSKLVSVKAQSIQDLASSLSGGNQQKVIVAKLLASKLKVIILDEPTKGVDVGAKYQIYEIMRSLSDDGIAIVMVSSEMPEVLGMSDRAVVMREGRVAGIFDTATATQEALLEAAMVAKGGVA
ncbi:MAG: sugar ABC transporter ATP-binding protein [Christensenellaceae bacterium]|nr:sugar ABC transporter ATP-binding protein [Christensenellaceae bacterium]